MSDRPNTPPPDELHQVREDIKRLQSREVELRALLLDHPELRTGAHYLVEIKTTSQQRTDIKELRAMHPDIAEQYTFPVEIVRVETSRITEDGEIVPARKAWSGSRRYMRGTA